jgi:glucokinase
MKLTLDIGGTNMRAGFFTEDGQLVRKERIPTPTKYNEGIQQICRFTEGTDVNMVALAIAGVLDKKKGTIQASPNLPDWIEKSLVKDITRKKRLQKIILENDAAAAALGEVSFGAGKGKRIVAYLTLGTGVGGARIVDGKLDANAMGFEPGIQTIQFDDARETPPLQKGTLESYVSGTVFQRLYGVSSLACTDPAVWKAFARHLSIGIANILVLWSPDIVIIGGGLSHQAPRFLAALREIVPTLVPFPHIPPLVVASLGDDAGLYGGLTLL